MVSFALEHNKIMRNVNKVRKMDVERKLFDFNAKGGF